MTAPAQQDGKLTAAKALFLGFFAAALGWAGVLVAALAVATEQTWSKGRPERDRARERNNSWVGTQRAWLGQDHRERQAQAKAQQEWLNSGAPADKEPAKPSRPSRAGAWLRRLLANVGVAGADFATGFGRGWRAGADKKRQGAGWRETSRARPVCGHCRRKVRLADGFYCQDCINAYADDDELAEDEAESGESVKECRNCGRRDRPLVSMGNCDRCTEPDQKSRENRPADPSPGPAGPSTTTEPNTPGTNWPRTGYCAGPCGSYGNLTAVGWCEPCLWTREYGFCSRCNGLMYRDGDVFRHGPNQDCDAVAPARSGRPLPEPELEPADNPAPENPTATNEGEPMAQAADSNAVVLAAKLEGVNDTVTTMADDVDTLNTITTELRDKVVRAADLAHSGGMPTEAIHAIEAVQQAAAALDARLGDFATSTAGASEQLTAASEGINPVQQAEDKLHAAGADGRALDTASA